MLPFAFRVATTAASAAAAAASCSSALVATAAVGCYRTFALPRAIRAGGVNRGN